MSNELNILKKMRSTIKGSITRLLNFVRDLDPNDTKETIDGFKIRLSRLNETFDKFNDIETQIFRVDPSEASLLEEVEENYFIIVNELNVWIRKRCLNNGFDAHVVNDTVLNATQNHSAEIRLPKINIPVFSGDYMEWQSFYDLFITTIHTKEYLTGSQKFQYLKGLLRGEAEALLRHYSVTETNYKEALQKLVQRYDRKRHTINAFIKSFLDQNNVSTASAASIRKLWDTSDEVIRGLKALGPNAETRDPWLIYVLVNKLDNETRSLWAQSTVDNDFPTLNDLFEFLAKRMDALESIKSCTRKPTQSQAPSTKTFAVMRVSCPICKTDDHKLFECKAFKELKTENRRELIKGEKRCFNCLNFSHNVYTCKSKGRCSHCKRKHHTLLHADDVRPSEETKDQSGLQATVALATSQEISTFQLSSKVSHVILPTTLVKIKDSCGEFRTFRALLDSSSQESFVTEECAQKLNLRRRNGRIMMKGLGDTALGCSRGKLYLSIQPLNNLVTEELKVVAYIVPRITFINSQVNLRSRDQSDLRSLNLADPNFNKRGSIDILLGTEVYYKVTTGKRIELTNGLIANDTIFGWVLAGRHLESGTPEISNCFSIVMDVDESLRKFWEIESIPTSEKFTENEQKCEDWFVATTTRSHDGRFIIKLPFKNDVMNLGSSRQAAVSRLLAMERRFKRDANFRKLYNDFMMEYEELHHMSEISSNPNLHSQYYLPHHGVLKESSSTTKLRVVFDASVKSNNQTSLNDNLLIGPVIQSSLFDIILRFRKHKFVITGDVEKMYRQIWVAESDRENQQIVWRSDDNQQIRHFRLNTLTYGTSPASFIATRCLKELSIKNKDTHPEASEAIKDDMYMDDLMTGTDSEEKLLGLKQNVCRILKQAQLNLRKISSNVPTIRDSNEQNIKLLNENPESSKVLGLIWNASTDNFSFQAKFEDRTQHTKRSILSESSKIFDPIGWLAPTVIRVKILFQNLWREPCDWDEHLSEKIEEDWLKCRRDLRSLDMIEIPRWIGTNESVELHGFCDASTMAYAASIYARVLTANGYKVQLITAKTKVAPIKQISIPRLELMGALILTKLMNHVKIALKMSITKIVLWTDSKIVLDWLSSHPRRWPTFVGNRTSLILESYGREQWKHVRSEENPADCASRGVSVKELYEHSLWWSGPSWLQEDMEFWPEQVDTFNTNEEEKSNTNVFTTICEKYEIVEQILNQYSSFYKMKRALALVIKFCNIYVKKQRYEQYLPSKSINEASELLIRLTQKEHFHDEIKCLSQGTAIPRKSSVLALNPFLDQSGLMRVGGRIDKSSLSYSTKHPIILPRNSILTKAILLDYHETLYHAGVNLMMSMVRHQYWIVRAKDVIKKTVKSCVRCTKQNPVMCQQLMGDLPRSRVEYTHPFQSVGVDYAGPFKVQIVRKRGQIPVKAYVCIFVCLSTKAVHIESVSNLSTDNFLGALSRFVDRRGICSDIFSDNGTNFVGANRQLSELYKFLKLNANDISYSLLRKNINWHFNPPGSPSMGGLWEAAVKATKQHLHRVVGDNILTVEEFNTLLTGIEAILNSRPLYVSSSDEEVLTPGHFLIGRPLAMLPEKQIQDNSPVNRWDIVKKLKQHFWHRFRNDYLTKLNTRNKWKNAKENIKINDIVLIKDEQLPAAQWSMGKVIGVSPGNDNLVRVATIKTASGVTSKHISKLCKIPVMVESDDSRRAI